MHNNPDIVLIFSHMMWVILNSCLTTKMNTFSIFIFSTNYLLYALEDYFSICIIWNVFIPRHTIAAWYHIIPFRSAHPSACQSTLTIPGSNFLNVSSQNLNSSQGLGNPTLRDQFWFLRTEAHLNWSQSLGLPSTSEIYCNVGYPKLFPLMHPSGGFLLGGPYLAWWWSHTDIHLCPVLIQLPLITLNISLWA